MVNQVTINVRHQMETGKLRFRNQPA